MRAYLNWYLVKFIYQVNQSQPKVQFNEHWRLVRADGAAWAKEKAAVLARVEERELDAPVNRKFIGVSDVRPVALFEDGAELFSSTQTPEDAHEYIRQVYSIV